MPPHKVVQFLTLKVVQFLIFISLYVSHIWDSLGHLKNRTFIESQVAMSVIQFLTFSSLGVIFYNRTCNFSIILSFLLLSFIFSPVIFFYVMLALFQQTRKTYRMKKKATKKERKSARKERKEREAKKAARKQRKKQRKTERKQQN